MDNVLCMCFLLALLAGSNCHEDAHQRIDALDRDLENHISKFENYKEDVKIEKNEILNNQTKERLALKRELKNTMKQQVKEALDEILSGEDYRDIIRSKVDQEVGHLRNHNALLKNQIHGLTKKYQHLEILLGVVKDQQRKFRKALKREPRCQCTNGEASKPTKTSNHSSVSANTTTPHPVTTTFTSTTTSYPVTTTVSTTTRRPRLTTPAPEERNNIFVVPLYQSSKHHPLLVNIHSNAVSVYSHLKLKQVRSVMYISKINSLFIGLRYPNKIISSELNSSSVKTIKDNVLTYGMAVDDKISTVFLTTSEPTWTISRMRLDGGEYTTVVSLSGYPRSIAVDTNTQIIYTCNYNNLLSVRYDGSGLTTLDTGSSICAVTLDIINGVLYYGNEKNLKKRSLSNTTTTKVTELTDSMWNLVYYRDVVYYMSRWDGTLGSVDVGQNNVVNILQTKPVSGVDHYSICLIP